MSDFFGQMTDSDFSQCLMCKHDHANGACDAFPSGVPLDILTNEHDHHKPHDGDNGILFEPRPHETSRVDFDIDQARDERGRWTSTGGSGGSVSKEKGRVASAKSDEDTARFVSEVTQTEQYKEVVERLSKIETKSGDINNWSKEQNTVNGEYTQERKDLHEKIVGEMLTKDSIVLAGEQPQAVFLIGQPGSGKTSVGAPLAKEITGVASGAGKTEQRRD